MKWFERIMSVGAIMMLSATSVFGAEHINTLDRKGLFGYESTGVAIRGYDNVAYSTEGGPV